MKFYVYNSFTNVSFQGNPAGIVFDFDKKLSHPQKQLIAKQLNLVETVFIHESDEADFEFQYFTPVKELPMAGHPSLAALSALKDFKKIDTLENIKIITKGGEIKAYGEADKIYLSQKSPTFHEVSNDLISQIPQIFNIEPNEISDMPVASVNAGLGHFIFATKTLKSLMSLSFEVEPLKNFCNQVNAYEAQVICMETYEKENDLHTRNLCPRLGIEDPACGNGTAALMGYFAKYILPEKDKISMKTEHGFIVERPSIIKGKSIKSETGQINVWIGGEAIRMLEGEFKTL